MPSNPPYDDDWSGESRNLETGSVRFSEAAMPPKDHEETPIYEHPCRKAAREIWARFVGIPITEPYDEEFMWLEDRLLNLKDQCHPAEIKRNLSEVCRELAEGPRPPSVPIRFDGKQ